MIFGKKRTQTEQLLASLFDAYDADVIAVRSDSCELLFANECARKHMGAIWAEATSCKEGYAHIFPTLCNTCSKLDDTLGKASYFEIKDLDDHLFTVMTNTILWSDNKAARIFIARDIQQERATQEKLYSLAYLDQLTGAPNRQKLKEDFEAIAEGIEGNRISGIMAIMDLDYFKIINDTYGHNAGDVMLKRLTEHLQHEEAFQNHVYRLGGDEFVLLLTDKPKQFDTQGARMDFYTTLLKKALVSYTMPNIEDKCSLSIGVAFFPQHGSTSSELLRKADIALYQAKNAGRNRVVFFEDKFDRAQKFRNIYINIEPILIKSGRTFGYELLDGTGDVKEKEGVVNLSEFNRTLDALGLTEMENKAKYFISFTKQLFSGVVQKNLPKDKFVIQIHASGSCSENEMLLYRQLHACGYLLALTGVNDGNINRVLLDVVDYCKIEINGMNATLQKSLIMQNAKKTFIATGVSTKEEYEAAQRRGFKLFQGYFFEQPTVTKTTKDIDPLKANYYRLLQLTSTDDYVDFQQISAIISTDVALSYKLLKLLNSATMGLRSKMSSIQMAVAYLGEENIKKWIAMLALQGVAADKPTELVRLSLIRARFGELLAPQLRPKRDPRHVFLTGMLSLLHVALDKTKEELVAEIPVADDIRESLVGKDGIYSDIVAFFGHYDYSNWEEITRFADEHYISCDAINETYIASVKWYNDLNHSS
ncbi:MAG: diguanylate cyclase [Clostridia bacterium]|nr:diguanylate cyclase [Clostridia bacterium]